MVVASCTPLTHQPLFQDSLRAAGLNPYLFEMANIRNQCSWVHSKDPETATGKAKELVHMAVARAALLQPQHTIELPVERSALVIGGGAAGMSAALTLAEQGFPVNLVEQESELGGNLRRVFTSPPDENSAATQKHPQHVLQKLIEGVQSNPAITLHLESQVVSSSGFMGNFKSTIRQPNGEQQEVAHGVTILATGGQEYRGPEYGYGIDPRIMTQQELEANITDRPAEIAALNAVAMILCVGPAEKYCSRICCTVALKNALHLKTLNPEMQIAILFKDIRTYGFKERLYQQAREKGILFLHYDDEHRPLVDNATGLVVKAWDDSLQRWVALQPDRVVLSMPIVPRPESHHLASIFKVSTDADGFFLEAHVKLRPVDFATEGLFMAGMAHYPKLLDETIIQAKAAAARAARVLSRDSLTAGGRVAVVDSAKCTGCLTCVRLCPFGVPKIKADLTGVGGVIGAAYIETAVCQGCGSCVAECPAQAIQLMHYTDIQLTAKVDALFYEATGSG